MSRRRVSLLLLVAIATATACIVSIWLLLITVVAHVSPPHPIAMQFGLKSGKKSSGSGSGSNSCGNDDEEEKFMYYAPHSGFSNQVVELKNALVFAKLLNRTLIVPPVLDHHAAWLGSCPKGRVLPPHRLRKLVWTTILDLILSSRFADFHTFLFRKPQVSCTEEMQAMKVAQKTSWSFLEMESRHLADLFIHSSVVLI